ncbi:hypothetical protein ABPG72_000537 [Tetrahymena utriculariae]
MDQIQINQGLMCLHHPSNEVIYLQVNEISQDQIIFYCETCISKDYDFKPQNCIRIKQLLESSADQIIFSWPPLNDRKLQKKVNDYCLTEGETAKQMQMKIIVEFDELRQQTLQKLKELEKQALQQVEKVYSFESQFIQKYKQISQVDYLKKIFEDYINYKGEMHTCLKYFINYYQQQKDNHSRIFQQFFDEQAIEINKLNDHNFCEIKQQIADYLDKIQYFNQDIQQLSIKKSFLPEVSFIKSTYAEQFNELNVFKNSILNFIIFQQVFKFNQNTSEQYYSNFILDPNKKYTFQFRSANNLMQEQQQGIFIIGLVRDEFKNTQQFTNDNLCCGILKSNNQIYLDSYTNGICQIVKGDFDYLSDSTEIQLVIHQSQNILYITDLPQNKHKAILMDQYLTNLQTYQNLRLCIKLYDNISIALTSAIVE